MTQQILDRVATDADIKEILYTAEQIDERVKALGRQISEDYRQKLGEDEAVVLVGVLKGVIIFIADLLRAIDVPTEVYFMDLHNYKTASQGSPMQAPDDGLKAELVGKHVIFVEDVVDAGLTLSFLTRMIQLCGPASVEICTMFNKEGHRLMETDIRYIGYELPDKYVVGYGLDHNERYRNLPYLAVLCKEALTE